MTRLILTILLAVAASACVAPKTTDGVVLEGTTWRVVKVDGGDPVAGHEPTLTFKTPGLSGSGGCNGYGSTHTEINGNEIKITNLGMGSKFCEAFESRLMQFERAFFDGLATATEIHIVGGRLELTTPTGQLTFELVSGPDPSLR